MSEICKDTKNIDLNNQDICQIPIMCYIFIIHFYSDLDSVANGWTVVRCLPFVGRCIVTSDDCQTSLHIIQPNELQEDILHCNLLQSKAELATAESEVSCFYYFTIILLYTPDLSSAMVMAIHDLRQSPMVTNTSTHHRDKLGFYSFKKIEG